MIAEPGRGEPPIFADVWQTKDFKSNDFGCVAKEGLRERFFGCVANTEVRGSRAEVGRRDGIPSPLCFS
jgi:hypothetical protein